MNLLKLAHQLIPYEKVTYYQWIGSTENDVMIDVQDYAAAIPELLVKVNAIGTDIFKRLGLDYKKNYVKLFSVQFVEGLSRTNSGDVFLFAGKYYQIQPRTGWQDTANWDSDICIEIPKPETIVP